ncbi:unnamed protein product [Closterium sp. NIES-65]|nr:unnamed protein product [Closterium sp. NIES-65]
MCHESDATCLRSLSLLPPTYCSALFCRYQQEVLRVALERNTIVYLETGMGKTLIAVMLMQARRQMRERSGKICVFLVPAVALVIQQAAVVEQQTDMRVGRYSTDTEIKYEASWVLKQVSRHEVLVMTPQVLVNLLQHAFLSLSSVDLLIFDECHHTAKDHAYATIMKTWYFSLRQSERPLIFGMTASPINTKGSGSEKSCVQQLLDFERILDSKVVSGGGATQRMDHPVPLRPPWGAAGAGAAAAAEGALHGVGQVMSGGGATQRADHPVLPFPLPPVFPSFCLPQLYTVLDRSCLVEVLPSAQTIQSHYDPPGEEQAQVLLQLLLQLLGRVKKERERIVLGSCLVEVLPSAQTIQSHYDPPGEEQAQVMLQLRERVEQEREGMVRWIEEEGRKVVDESGGMGQEGGREGRVEEGREQEQGRDGNQGDHQSNHQQRWTAAYGEVRRRMVKRVKYFAGALDWCLTDLGRYPAFLALQALRAQAASGGMDQHEENARLRDAFAAVRLEFINRCEAFLRCGLPPEAKEPGPGGLEATLSLASHPSALLTPKIAHLLSLLRLYASQPSPTIVIFVERIVTAHSLSRLLRLLPSVAASLKADFVVGAGAAKIGISINQGGTAKHSRPDSAISRFRAGKLNVLVATSAAEEGMDIPACHTVIRFDRILTHGTVIRLDRIPNVRSMLQSRGRARKPGAHFRVLVQRGDSKYQEDLAKLMRNEGIMHYAQRGTVQQQLGHVLTFRVPPSSYLFIPHLSRWGDTKYEEDLAKFMRNEGTMQATVQQQRNTQNQNENRGEREGDRGLGGPFWEDETEEEDAEEGGEEEGMDVDWDGRVNLELGAGEVGEGDGVIARREGGVDGEGVRGEKGEGKVESRWGMRSGSKVLVVPSTGALVTRQGSVALVYQFCNTLGTNDGWVAY